MRIKGIVSYKGNNYHGWQKQVGDNSIEEEIEKVLSKVLDEPINIYASGRTDAGVHAYGQVFHFDTHKESVDLSRLTYSLNMMLNEDIKIISLEKVDDNFHARYSAKAKIYEYKILLRSKDPFNYETHYLCPYPIDIYLLKESLKKFIGVHDFRNLSSKEEDEDDFVREIYSIDINHNNDEINIIFKGNGFMRYMIRFIVGVSLAISQNKEDISYIDMILNEDNPRNITSYKAPAEGLYLVEVEY